MLLDEFMADSDVSTRHTILVAASPARVFPAARAADLRYMDRQSAHGDPALPAAGWRCLGPSGAEGDWSKLHVVGERPGEEVVLGIMGRFWTPTGGVIAADAARFRTPPPPGLAQGLWNFRVEPSRDGTLLSTETRVRCGDRETRRSFLRYWRLVRPGSGLIRRSLLRQIRASAERHTS